MKRERSYEKIKQLALVRRALRGLGYQAKKKEEYTAASFLMASAFVGANYKKIGYLLKLKPDVAYQLSGRARRAGIFVGDKINAEWSDSKDGATAFGLDVLVMEGKLKRDTVNHA